MSILGLPQGVSGTAVRDVVGFFPLQALHHRPRRLLRLVARSHPFRSPRLRRRRGNPKAASRAGIPLEWTLFRIYVLCSMSAALAGFLYVLRFNGGVANAGDALMLSSVAAIAIGGASMLGGQGRILGTIVGALVIAVIQNGLVILGIDPSK